jgi:cell wall-associated NlpC family hydrolase
MALRTLVFPGPSIKLPPLEALPFGAQLIVAETTDRMAITPTRGYVPSVHLAPLKQYEADFVAVAERFVGAPYLWGGKTVLGLDCSGLVQVALAACGIASPRDSDMQEAALGVPIRVASGLADPQRGDLIFWEDHVAVVRDRTNLIHANAFHMAVAIEPISQAVERIRASGAEISSIRRLPRPNAS